MNFFGWIKNLLFESEQHHGIWEAACHTEDNGLTIFQNSCNEALIATFFHFPQLKDNQYIEGEDDKHIVGTLPKTQVKYQIFTDGVQIGPYYYLSSQDYDTPEQLIRDFIRFAKQTTQLGQE